MVNEAEKYRTEDEKQKETVAAKNGLESYCFNTKSTVEDEKLKDKISASDKQVVLDKSNNIIKWLDANQLADKEEYERKQKELEAICNPIVTKLYRGTANMPGGFLFNLFNCDPDLRLECNTLPPSSSDNDHFRRKEEEKRNNNKPYHYLFVVPPLAPDPT
ncbi:PREDICTED: heat shock 70 kDa protein cognate 4-like [Habropoda laboriosa]|uniref:heat shock 70 kDa protein cognate 4-like n=1 Tax=Habropoda laboriosa TaxID=597456 RepID=UPI00083D1499|nr:PREDICTED: heat shock 70 kDa protein cognate 4-like [Habropoda laboriosa]